MCTSATHPNKARLCIINPYTCQYVYFVPDADPCASVSTLSTVTGCDTPITASSSSVSAGSAVRPADSETPEVHPVCAPSIFCFHLCRLIVSWNFTERMMWLCGWQKQIRICWFQRKPHTIMRAQSAPNETRRANCWYFLFQNEALSHEYEELKKIVEEIRTKKKKCFTKKGSTGVPQTGLSKFELTLFVCPNISLPASVPVSTQAYAYCFPWVVQNIYHLLFGYLFKHQTQIEFLIRSPGGWDNQQDMEEKNASLAWWFKR